MLLSEYPKIDIHLAGMPALQTSERDRLLKGHPLLRQVLGFGSFYLDGVLIPTLRALEADREARELHRSESYSRRGDGDHNHAWTREEIAGFLD